MTRRGAGEGSISQRKDGRWQARIDLGVDALGRRRRKYLYGASKPEVVRKLRAALRGREAGQLAGGDQQGRTVRAWLEHWLETVHATREPNTYAAYRRAVHVHLAPAEGPPGLGRIRLDRLEPAQIERFLLAKQRAGLAPSHIHLLRAVLSSALRRAQRQGLVGRNAAAAGLVELPTIDRGEHQVLSLEQARAFLARIKGDRLYALFLTALMLGQRRSEILGLRWRDVDFEGERLRMIYKLARVDGVWQLRRPKTVGSRHTLPMLPPLAAALREHRVQQQWEREVAGSSWWMMEHHGQPVELVFTSERGAPLRGDYVRERFQRELVAAGLPRLRFHDTRHSAASIMLALGVPLKTVSLVLGHANYRITSDVYGHLEDDVVREQLAGLGAAWADEPEPPVLREEEA